MSRPRLCTTEKLIATPRFMQNSATSCTSSTVCSQITVLTRNQIGYFATISIFLRRVFSDLGVPGVGLSASSEIWMRPMPASISALRRSSVSRNPFVVMPVVMPSLVT